MISVIVTAYDSAEFISDCINSILNQYYDGEIEVLVAVDDCSKTLEAVKRFPEVGVYVPEKNVGTYLLRNSLSTYAKGEYLMFFDSDDIMTHNVLKESVKGLKDHVSVRSTIVNFSDYMEKNKRHFAHGQFATRAETFREYDGFRPFRVSCDSDYHQRTKHLPVQLHEDLFIFRRVHGKNLTVASDTSLTSDFRKEVTKKIRELRHEKYPMQTVPLKCVQKPTTLHLTTDCKNIGIGITTKDRRRTAKRCISEVRKFAPTGAKIAIVDDGSRVPYEDADYRFPESVGIAKAKNKCLELLQDCKHIFLFDDDIYPITEGWWVPYVKSPEKHLTYSFKPTYLIKAGHKVLNETNGCMLYVHSDCLDVIGGFDSDFEGYGWEHNDYSCRAFNAGLTSWLYMDVIEGTYLFHSLDKIRGITSTGRNYGNYWKNRELYNSNSQGSRYCPFSESQQKQSR